MNSSNGSNGLEANTRPRSAILKDVAERAGVSKMTVSAVLTGNRNNNRFSAATKDRVEAAAADLQYIPSAVARGMTRRRMNVIGVILPSQVITLVNDPYICGLLDGIMSASSQRRQNTTIFTGEVWNDISKSIPVFCDGRCDGLILISPHFESPVIPVLLERNVPFVLVNGAYDDSRVSSITVNNREAMRELVGHVAQQGHTRIAYLGGSAHRLSASERLLGYRDAVRDFGLVDNPRWVYELKASNNFHGNLGYDWTRELMALDIRHRPTAFCCFNDEVALGACAAVRDLGLRVPDDISVVGFDDTERSASATPGLTTVHLPTQEIGSRAAITLIDLITQPPQRGTVEILPTSLVLRGSVGPPRKLDGKYG